MTPRKGDLVRVTYEGVYEYYDEGQKGHRVTSTVGRASLFAPPGATLEVIEDLRPGDVYRSALGTVAAYQPNPSEFPWLVPNCKKCGLLWHGNHQMKRPLTLLVRDGKPVTS